MAEKENDKRRARVPTAEEQAEVDRQAQRKIRARRLHSRKRH